MEIVGIEERIINYMQEEYHLTPSRSSIELIIDSGFRFDSHMRIQYCICNDVQKLLKGKKFYEGVARLFVVAYGLEPTIHTIKQPPVIIWWLNALGICEYNLGDSIYKEKLKNKLFNKSIAHLLEAERCGDTSKVNASYIGSCYRKLKNYESAIQYLLLARERADDSKYNAGQLGECYFTLGNFDEGLAEYEMALEIAIKEKFNSYWAHTLDHSLSDSFHILKSKILSLENNTSEQKKHIELLVRFGYLYDIFEDWHDRFWSSHGIIKATKLRTYVDGIQKDSIREILLELESKANYIRGHKT